MPDRLENPLLNIPLEYPDAAAADFGTVQHHIIGFRLDPAGVAFQILNVLVPGRSEGMMHRHEAFFLFIIFEHWEIQNPGETELVGIDQVHPSPHFQPQLAHGIGRHIGLVGDDQHQVAFFGLGGLTDPFQLFVAEEFGNLGFQALGGVTDPGQSLGAVLANIVDQAVQFPARNPRIPFDIDAFDATAGGQHRFEHLEVRTAHRVRQVKDFHAKAQVRFVRAVFVHGLVIGKPLHRQRYFHVQRRLENFRNHGFHDRQDIIAFHERHFDVELGEFRLTVCPQVFIPETTGNLKITLVPCHHENLLENLR